MSRKLRVQVPPEAFCLPFFFAFYSVTVVVPMTFTDIHVRPAVVPSMHDEDVAQAAHRMDAYELRRVLQ